MIADGDGSGSSCGLGVVALVFGQDEAYVRPAPLNCFGLDESLDAQVRLIGFVTHVLHFRDGDVVALVGRGAGVGEISNGAENNNSSDPNAERLTRQLHFDPNFRALNPASKLAALEEELQLLYESRRAGSTAWSKWDAGLRCFIVLVDYTGSKLLAGWIGRNRLKTVP